jgi:hypothetical protein
VAHRNAALNMHGRICCASESVPAGRSHRRKGSPVSAPTSGGAATKATGSVAWSTPPKLCIALSRRMPNQGQSKLRPADWRFAV